MKNRSTHLVVETKSNGRKISSNRWSLFTVWSAQAQRDLLSVEVDPAHELEPEVGSSREAMELDPAFVPDHSDRMALLAEYPVYR